MVIAYLCLSLAINVINSPVLKPIKSGDTAINVVVTLTFDGNFYVNKML